MSKPHVIACANGLSGHLRPVLSLSKGLIDRGYDVTVISATSARKKVEAIGADFIPLGGVADFDDNTAAEQAALLKSGKSDRPVLDLANEYVDAMPLQVEAIRKAVRPNSVIISEVMFFGSHVLNRGSDINIPWISLGITPFVMRVSKTQGLDLDPNNTEHARRKAMDDYVEKVLLQKAIKNHAAMLENLGSSTLPDTVLIEYGYLTADKALQLCPPSLEAPRVKLPEQFAFAGSVRHPSSSVDYPTWWPELQGKRVIGVSQGTYTLDYDQLLIPTIMALKDEDVLTVAILGKRNATLDIELPANCRVIDFLPYDELLPYCECFVYNGGYGGLQHCLINGTPMIIGGDSEDKIFVAMRAKFAGIGIVLPSANPSQEDIVSAVRKIHEDPTFKKRAMTVKEESDRLNPLDVLEENILELHRNRTR